MGIVSIALIINIYYNIVFEMIMTRSCRSPDINECQSAGGSPCGDYEVCENKIGHYSCDKCLEGTV